LGGVEDDLVVLPEPLKETKCSALVNLLTHTLQNLAERSLSVYRAEQSVFVRVDGED
jgi:hypothetical protein